MISFVAKSAVQSGSAAPSVGVTLNVPYMGGIIAGDKLFILAGSSRPGGSIGSITTTDPDWVARNPSGTIFMNSAPAIVGHAALFEKIADGTESGTVAFLAFSDAAVDAAAQMYQYRQSTGQLFLIESVQNKLDGNGNATVTWPAITVGGNARTLLAFSVQRSGTPNTPAGYTQRATDTALSINLKLADLENVGADGAVTAANGNTDGWGTHHVSLFSPTGRSFIVN